MGEQPYLGSSFVKSIDVVHGILGYHHVIHVIADDSNQFVVHSQGAARACLSAPRGHQGWHCEGCTYPGVLLGLPGSEWDFDEDDSADETLSSSMSHGANRLDSCWGSCALRDVLSEARGPEAECEPRIGR